MKTDENRANATKCRFVNGESEQSGWVSFYSLHNRSIFVMSACVDQANSVEQQSPNAVHMGTKRQMKCMCEWKRVNW